MIRSLFLALALTCVPADDGVIEIPAFETHSLINLLEANGHREWASGLREQAEGNDPLDQTHYWNRETYVLVLHTLNTPKR